MSNCLSKLLAKCHSKAAVRATLLDFVRDKRGNVALLFGLTLIPLLIAVGVAVDYGRALMIKEQMEDAADAAALAIGSWTNLDQSQLAAKAQDFYNANYASSIGASSKLNVGFDGDNITVTVNGTMPTTFMRLADVDDMNVAASSTVTKKQRNIELALVLDTTGSMAQNGKMTALKSAATTLVNNLFEGDATSDTLKIAVVPFAAAVRLPVTTALNGGWIDTKAQSAVAQEDFGSGVVPYQLYRNGNLRVDWGGCVRERSGDYELTDDAPDPGNPDTLFAPYLAPDEPDRSNYSGYSNSYLDDGDVSKTTTQCSGSGRRQTCRQVTTTESPTQIEMDTGKYRNASVNSSSTGPDFNCAASTLIPLTSTKSTVLNAINALSPNGSTAIPAGLLWGWRVLSPTAPFTEGAAYDDQKWVKAIVLLTDGENDVGGGGNGVNKSYYSAFGYVNPPSGAQGHLGSSSGSQADSTLDSKLLTVCSAVKAMGIRLYTIGFQVTSHSQSLLQQCASKPDMFYNSPSTSDLDGIFSDIAQGLSDLRIAR